MRAVLIWAAALASGIFAAQLAARISGLVERLYSSFLYPVLIGAIAIPARSTGISLAQMILLGLFVLLPVWAFAAVRRVVRHRSYRAGFGSPHRLVALLALSIWGFQLAWGLNHARPPLDQRMGLSRPRADASSLARLTRRLAAEANRTHDWAVTAGQLQPATDDASELRLSKRVVSDRLEAAYRRILPRTAHVSLPPPKQPAVIGRLLPSLGISGFYFPFTAEASVAVGLPDPSAVFVSAHEMAHQRGIAREDEANFLAYLACRESGNPAARYAGALGAYGIAARALWRADPDSGRGLGDLLADGPRADRAAIRAFWERRRTRLEPVAQRVNDRYLKASGHRAGTGSYGLAVELLLAWEESGGMEGE